MSNIIQQLKDKGRYEITALLTAMGIFCFTLSILRVVVTSSSMYLFLNWNLFLAFIPFGISSLFVLKPRLKKRKWFLAILLFSWLLFFPNAPYIFTDLFHLRFSTAAPIWFDMILVLSFAWTGLIFGIISLMDIEKILRKEFNFSYYPLLITSMLFLASFGVYLGRFLRWNSWDIINQPNSLMNDILVRIIHPFEHPTTWGVTILMGILLNMFYWTIKLLKEKFITPPSTVV